MILFEKFGQHQPLNRQADRYAREGVPLSLSTLADQVGGCCAVLDSTDRPIERLLLHLRDNRLSHCVFSKPLVRSWTAVVRLKICCSAKPARFDPVFLSLARTGRQLIRSVISSARSYL